MEPAGAMLEGEWSSLSGSMYTTEEADFKAQFRNCPYLSQVDYISYLRDPSSFWSSNESLMTLDGANEGSFYSLDIANTTDSYHFSQGNSSYSGGSSINFSSSSQESYNLNDSHPMSLTSMNYHIGDGTDTVSYLVDGDDCSNHEGGNAIVENYGGNPDEPAPAEKSLDLQLKKQAGIPAPEPSEEYKSNQSSENSKKRSQSFDDNPNNKRNVRLKRSQKLVPSSKNDEESNAGFEAPASSSCCSEDDSNTSQVLNGGARSSSRSKGTSSLDLVGKTRASKGTATDPQSLYARKRRERINERLRILQNLVPNGTKVDISTMLEEAVQYVKFLQLQIKLLSSDDLWMYAPIACNGMNLELDLKVPAPRS